MDVKALVVVSAVLFGWGWSPPAPAVPVSRHRSCSWASDAALGVPVVTNPAVPRRIRELITVESGLNDGIATPVVMFAIAGAAACATPLGPGGRSTARRPA